MGWRILREGCLQGRAAVMFHVEQTWFAALQQRWMISLAPYRNVLASRELRYLFAASIIGRLPIGMCGLAILLLVQGASASFATGGAATGCYVAGLACIAPAIGRVIDRHGPRVMLMIGALLFPASLAALLGAVAMRASSTWVFTFAAAAGASFPPITVCIRTYLRQRLTDDATLSTAYSLDSVLIETMFIIGPLLVALFVAFASARGAVWFAAATGCIGVFLFQRSSALREWKIEPRSHATLLGPLAQPRFVALIAIVVCYACAFGLTELGAAAYAAEAHRPALAGVFLGLMSIGSAAGGLAYGSARWHAPLLHQFGTMLAIMGVGLLVLAVPWTLLAFGAWCVLAGVVMAPALIIQSMLVAKTAKPEHTTEAFTWSTSALLAGVGFGMALGGIAAEAWNSSAAFAAAAAAAVLAAAGAFWLSRR
jgi:MFS family permease